MDKFVLYKDGDGVIYGEKVTDKQPEDKLKAFLTKNGYELVRPDAVAGSSESDAVGRYKAAKLRGEAKEIYKNVESPEAIEAYTKKMDKIYKGEDAKQERMESSLNVLSGGKYKSGGKKSVAGAAKYAFDVLKQGGRAANLATAVAGVPVDIFNRYELTSDYPFIKDEDPSINIGENFSDRLLLPFENDLAEEVLGDPTFVPSMAIPGVGEARAAKIATKIPWLKNILMKADEVDAAAKVVNASKGAKVKDKVAKYAVPAVENLTDNVIQSTVSAAANPEQSIAENTLIGTGTQAGANLLGRASKGVGTKLIESTLKPSKGNKKQFSVDNMMGAANPDGTKVIGAFTGAEGASRKMEDALSEWEDVQMPTIRKLSEDIMALQNKKGKVRLTKEEEARLQMLESAVGEMIGRARADVRAKYGSQFNEDDAAKALNILEMEERRLKKSMPPDLSTRFGSNDEQPIGIAYEAAGGRMSPPSDYSNTKQYPDFISLHEAKKAFGKKAKFDRTDATSGDPITRGVYKGLYGDARDIITDTEQRYIRALDDPKFAEFEARNNFVMQNFPAFNEGKKFEELASKYRLGSTFPEFLSNIPESAKQELLQYNKATAAMFPKVPDMQNASTDALGRILYTNPHWMNMFRNNMEQVRYIPQRVEGASTYDEASRAMAPIMSSIGVVDEAVARMDKNNLFGLSNYLAANAAGTASGGDWKAALAGMILPTITQSMPTGTALYRGGEKLQKGGRYAVPTMIRAIPQEDEE